MSVGYLGLPASLELSRDSLRRIATAVNNILAGKQNNVTTLTLTANAATTTFAHPLIGAGSHLSFTPTTANAAAEIGNGTMYVSARGKQTSTITNANNAQVDRTFTVEITG